MIKAPPNPNLTPGEANSIVTLRGLLEEAIRRTSVPTELGRRIAAILLDGAAEAAIAAGLAKHNISSHEKDSLQDSNSKVVEALKGANCRARLGELLGSAVAARITGDALAESGVRSGELLEENRSLHDTNRRLVEELDAVRAHNRDLTRRLNAT